MAMNLTRKILAAHLAEPGDMIPGQEIFLHVDQTLTHDINAVMTYLAFEAIGLDRVRTEASVSYLDHNLLYLDNKTPDDHIYLQSAARRYGVYVSRPGNGICHTVHMARFGAPGRLSVGGDSHTPHGGAIGMLCIGAGGMDVAAAMKEGHLMWASSNDTIMLSIIIAMVWQFSGYVAVIFLAAIKNVPTNIINAAKLDGAYMPRIYARMVIPQLKGAMGSCITILAMYALRSFDFIVSLVGYTTSSAWTLPVWMYNEAFQSNNFAYSAAISCFLLALVLVLILPLTYWTNRRK